MNTQSCEPRVYCPSDTYAWYFLHTPLHISTNWNARHVYHSIPALILWRPKYSNSRTLNFAHLRHVIRVVPMVIFLHSLELEFQFLGKRQPFRHPLSGFGRGHRTLMRSRGQLSCRSVTTASTSARVRQNRARAHVPTCRIRAPFRRGHLRAPNDVLGIS